MSERVIKNFVMTTVEAEIIAKKAREMGDSSDSAALRVIVREWETLSAQEYARRYSQPNPLITIGDALRAHEGESQAAGESAEPAEPTR